MAEHASLQRMMALFDCSANTIADWTNKGLAIRLKRGVYDLDASTPRIVAHLREAAAGRPSTKDDLTAEKTRLTKAQADGKELENRVREGGLLDAKEALYRWSSECVRFRMRMLALPGQVAMLLPHLTRFDVAQVDRAVRDALSSFVDDRAGADPDDTAAEAEPAPATP